MQNKPFRYLELKTYEDGIVVKRMDLSHQSPHNADKIERGMNINLNHERYYTFLFESEYKLPIIEMK